MEAKQQMEVIGDQLDIALEYGLEVEAIYYALLYMQKNPSKTPVEAFVLGVTEFIK